MILYEALTGRVPFEADSAVAGAEAGVGGPAPAERSLTRRFRRRWMPWSSRRWRRTPPIGSRARTIRRRSPRPSGNPPSRRSRTASFAPVPVATPETAEPAAAEPAAAPPPPAAPREDEAGKAAKVVAVGDHRRTDRGTGRPGRVGAHRPAHVTVPSVTNQDVESATATAGTQDSRSRSTRARTRGARDGARAGSHRRRAGG